MILAKPSVLSDTNVISYILNGQSLAARYEPHLARNVTLVSFQTIEELRYGAIKANWEEKRKQKLELFLETLTPIYPDDAICSRCAQLRADVAKKGRTLERADAWIAATALRYDVPLVTYNQRHFNFIDNLVQGNCKVGFGRLVDLSEVTVLKSLLVRLATMPLFISRSRLEEKLSLSKWRQEEDFATALQACAYLRTRAITKRYNPRVLNIIPGTRASPPPSTPPPLHPRAHT